MLADQGMGRPNDRLAVESFGHAQVNFGKVR